MTRQAFPRRDARRLLGAVPLGRCTDVPGPLLSAASAGPKLRVVPRVLPPRSAMEPLVVLLLLPVLIGVASVALFRDSARASCVATFVSPLAVFCCLSSLDPEGRWNWLAALLVSPLAIAFALAAMMIRYGRAQVRKRHPGNGA